MRLFRPLRDRNMALLWFGTSIGQVGLQVYDASIAWIAVDAVGAHASWVIMGTAALSLLFSLFGGLLVDRFEAFSSLTAIDAARAALVLLPALWLLAAPDATWFFAPTVLLMALLRPLPYPVIYAALPRLTRDGALLNAMNALIDAAARLSRILGPLLIGALQTVLSQIAILTAAALGFFASAAAAFVLHRRVPPEAKPADSLPSASEAVRPLREVLEALQAARARPPVWFALVANVVSNGAWQVGYILGVALMIQSEALGDLGGYAAVMAAYGAGNIACSLVVGNLEIRRGPWWTRAGHVVAGIGYCAMAAAPDIRWLMAAAAFTACGGPLADLSFLSQIQAEASRRMVARLYRLKLVGAWTGALLATAISAWLFAWFGARPVIAACGAALLLSAVLGFRWQARQTPG